MSSVTGHPSTITQRRQKRAKDEGEHDELCSHCKFASLKLLSTAYTSKTIRLDCVRIEKEFEELLGKGNSCG
jgi:hypothetical protein